MSRRTAPAPVNLTEIELRRKVRTLSQTVRQLETAYVDAANIREQVAAAIESVPPPKLISLPTPKKHDGPVTMVLCLNDWQIGLKFDSDEVQAYNSYSAEIAQRRLRLMTEKLTRWTALQRNCYRIDKVVVLGLGDINDGALRVENLMYTECPPPEQAVRSGYMLAEVLYSLEQLYPEVQVEWLNSDNHSRMFPKPMAQGRGRWSYNPVTAAVCQALLKGHDTVKFTAHDEIKVDVEVEDRLLLIEHGNDIRSWMGIPYYGMQRLRGREAERRGHSRKRPFDYFICGHWHAYHLEENMLVAPALCGTTPYDHSVGRYASPGQVCFMVGRYGWFGHLKMDLEAA